MVQLSYSGNCSSFIYQISLCAKHCSKTWEHNNKEHMWSKFSGKFTLSWVEIESFQINYHEHCQGLLGVRMKIKHSDLKDVSGAPLEGVVEFTLSGRWDFTWDLNDNVLRSRKRAAQMERAAGRKALGREWVCCVPRTKQGRMNREEAEWEAEMSKIMLSLRAPGWGSGLFFFLSPMGSH